MELKANDELMDEALAIIPEAFDGVVEGIQGLRFTEGGWQASFVGNEGLELGVYIADYANGEIGISPFTVEDKEVDRLLASITAKRKDSAPLPKPQPL